jgi:DNA mismatch endonuclease (patch repair protein)
MDVHSAEQRRRNMQAIKSKGAKDEVALAKALWNRGYRYRKNDRKVFGCPDLVFHRYQLAIFVDSEYFHGRDWENQKLRIQTNRHFWWNKIERNMMRDQQVNEVLARQGWKVLRFWAKDVRNNLEKCITKTEQLINN